MATDDGPARDGSATDLSPREAGLAAAAALADPVRRRVYDLVAASADPIGRDATARIAGLARTTAAFHLERLVDAGLLDVEYRRLSGRSGPGAGRPAKLYRPARAELAVSVPPRRYDLAGAILVEAVALTADRDPGTGRVLAVAVGAAARDTGRRAADGAADLPGALRAAGLDPRDDDRDDGGIVLGTCPFHTLAKRHPDIVCDLNHALVCGMAEAVGADPERVRLDPGAGGCCIRIAPPTG